MKSYTFSVIVKCKDIYEYYVQKGDLKLYVDPLYKQGARKITYGIVEAPPEVMPDWAQVTNPLKAGDKVYFHFNALDETTMLPESQGLFVIPMDMIFCYVRDGVIMPMDGKVFCLPYYDPSLVTLDINGSPVICRTTKSGIITEYNVKHSHKQATVSHIGKPLIGFSVLDIAAGDVVCYAKDADFENVIEGTTYFVMDQDLLLMKL